MEIQIIILNILTILFLYIILNIYLKKKYEKILEEILTKERKKAIESSRSILKGQINEQLSPYLPNFPLNPSECKFIGAPIDFISFVGLDNQNVTEIVFVEVKTNKAKLNKTENSIKKTIQEKKVRFVEYRI
jgi:predicted Holliday junction resolvase-like endonuclease